MPQQPRFAADSEGWDVGAIVECWSLQPANEDLSQTNLLAPLVGHVGDGNFHLQYLIDPDNEDELSEARWVNGRMIERAIEMGGTCTGENGVGHGKIKYLEAEHGAPSLAVMASIKRALDPENIMNPGKILSIN